MNAAGRLAPGVLLLLLAWAPAARTGWKPQFAGLTGLDTRQMQHVPTDSNTVWATPVGVANAQGVYIRTTNGGGNWTASVVPGIGATIRTSSMTAVDAQRAWVAFELAASGGGIYGTTNGGAGWARQSSAFGSSGDPRFVKFFDAQNGLAVGNPNGGEWEIYTTVNGGQVWTRVPADSIEGTPLPGEVAYVGGAPGSYGDRWFWFPTSGQSVYRTSNRGRSWTVSRNAYPGAFGMGVAFRDSVNGLLSGDGPNIGFRRTTDGGSTWTQVSAPAGVTPSYIAAIPGTAGGYMATSNDLFGWQPGSAYTQDDGATWTTIDARNRGRAVFLSPSRGWAGGTTDSVSAWVNELQPMLADLWRPQAVTLPSPLNTYQVQLAPVDSTTVWGALVSVAGSQGTYTRTTNGGRNWTVSAVPGIGLTIRASAISAVDGQRAWVAFELAGSGGGVFRTSNGGIGWSRQTGAFGSGGDPRFVKFFDAQNGLAVGNPNGGYWEISTTSNGGDTWTRVPTDSIPAPAGGEEAYVGGVSSSYGDRWFWFPTNRQSVYRTTNRGRSWTVSRNAFPSAVGMGVAFRDSLNGLLSGDGPGIGFRRTTDGGGTWTQVNAPSGITPSYVAAIPGTSGSYMATSYDLFGWQAGSAYTRDNGTTWYVVDRRNHGRSAFLSPSLGWSAGEAGTLYGWDRAGYGGFVLPVEGSKPSIPEDLDLAQNYPNPFNPVTTIRFRLPSEQQVRVSVFDLLGRELAVLVNEMLSAGSHEVKFDAQGFASGVYLCRLSAGSATQSRRMVLLR